MHFSLCVWDKVVIISFLSRWKPSVLGTNIGFFNPTPHSYFLSHTDLPPKPAFPTQSHMVQAAPTCCHISIRCLWAWLCSIKLKLFLRVFFRLSDSLKVLHVAVLLLDHYDFHPHPASIISIPHPALILSLIPQPTKPTVC